MNIEEKKFGNVILLKLSGRIDAFTAERLEEEISSIINAGKLQFVMNFGDVNYISSAGLRVFLSTHKRLSENKGDMKFTDVSDEILKVFQLVGFDKIFEIYSSDNEALSNFKRIKDRAA
jgi:anti-sigma B factor antagonist/stage II sporulation protein AA (anti-sigma F factor antagonist)